MTYEETLRANRLRYKARRQGLWLVKSRLRDPDAHGFGTWHLINPVHNTMVLEGVHTLDEIEQWLTHTHPLQVSQQGAA